MVNNKGVQNINETRGRFVSGRIKPALLLFNISLLLNAYKINSENAAERFSFKIYKSENNPIEIEHINPQQSGGNIMDSESCFLLEQKWDVLLDNAKDVVFYEGKLNQELFREALYETWLLFKEGIDFEAMEEDYSLHIDMACIFARVHEYSNLYQAFDYGKEADTIDVSAEIVKNLEWIIINREDFDIDKPILTFRRLLFGNIYKLTYDLETGVLTVEDGHDEEKNDIIFSEDGSLSLVEQRKMKPINVKDIAHWWENQR